jgi:4a-hydroxytetrahydrobiopterin dehydratase
MARPTRLDDTTVNAWLGAHPGWERHGSGTNAGISRAYTFPDFATALSFVVRIGLLAEKRDHHPDVELGWGKAKLRWSTHDAGGISQLDLDAAEASDARAG